VIKAKNRVLMDFTFMRLIDPFGALFEHYHRELELVVKCSCAHCICAWLSSQQVAGIGVSET
jgi:hypothetical protein